MITEQKLPILRAQQGRTDFNVIQQYVFHDDLGEWNGSRWEYDGCFEIKERGKVRESCAVITKLKLWETYR